MSRWTYVTGAVVLDTYSNNAIKEVEEFLKTAPKITGSEKNAEIFINQPNGNNVFESSWSEELGDYVLKEYQTDVILTIHGALRDREIDRTKTEVSSFLDALKKKFDIDFKSIQVMDDITFNEENNE